MYEGIANIPAKAYQEVLSDEEVTESEQEDDETVFYVRVNRIQFMYWCCVCVCILYFNHNARFKYHFIGMHLSRHHLR